MNKLTMKATKRILCLLLCLLCLLAAVPLSAIAEGEESPTHIETCVEGCTGEDCACTCHTAAEPAAHIETCVEGCTGEGCTCTCHAATVTEQDNKEQDEQGEQSALFGALLSCTTCEEMHTILDNADVTAVEALTYDELTALIEHVGTLTDDDAAKEELIYDLTVLRDGEVMDLKPGQGSNGYTLSMSHYSPDATVNYLLVTANKSLYTNQDAVTSVTANDQTISNPETLMPESWSNGVELSSIYPNLKKNEDNTTTPLVITPAAGYYVKEVVVACTGGQDNQSPLECNTWNANAAYQKTFSISSVGTVTIDLPSNAFGHNSDSKKYCILIVVAPIPTPLYVEYNFGEIGTLLGDAYNSSPFANADGWTDDSTANVYKPNGDSSDGGVKTEDTQFKYTYDENTYSTDAQKAAAVGSWKHTTNTVTDSAKKAAANIGYYFAGWKYTYYSSATEKSNASGSYNNYTYTFDNEYSDGGIVDEDQSLALTTNVRLVAQWAPIQLQVTKEVKGLKDAGGTNDTLNYTITLKKQNDDGFTDNTQTFTITGDGTMTKTYGAGLTGNNEVNLVITPGTYEIEETGTYDKDGSYYCHTTYETKTVEVTADGTVKELKVVNAFDKTPPTATLTIKKTVSGNLRDWSKEFEFTVNINGTSNTYKLKHEGTQVIENVPVGAQVTVTENPDGYEFSVGSETTVNGTTDSEKYSFTFTMPAQNTTVVFNNNLDAKIETGIILDALPYILILAIVAGGVVLMLLRRRRSYED